MHGATLTKITRLQLLLSAAQVACLFILTAAAILELGRRTIFAAAGSLLVVFLAGSMIDVRLARANPNSAWLSPISDKTGFRIFETSLLAYLSLVGLLSAGFVSIGFVSSFLAGFASCALVVTGLAIGRTIRSRSITTSMWPYAVSFSMVVPMQFLFLRVGGTL